MTDKEMIETLKDCFKPMSKKEFIETLKDCFKEDTVKTGFKVNSKGYLEKKTKTHTYIIFIVFNKYNTIRVKSIYPIIQFNYIEQPLNRIHDFDCKESEIKSITQSSKTIHCFNEQIVRLDLDIYSGLQVAFFSDRLIAYINDIANPFFEKYSDLQYINQEILAHDMPYKEGKGYDAKVSAFYELPFMGIDLKYVQRRMFIMKYCKDSRYDDFVSWYENKIDTNEFEAEEWNLKKRRKIINDTKEYLSKLVIG